MARAAVTAAKRSPKPPQQGDPEKLAAVIEAALPRMPARTRRWFEKLLKAHRDKRPAQGRVK